MPGPDRHQQAIQNKRNLTWSWLCISLIYVWFTSVSVWVCMACALLLGPASCPGTPSHCPCHVAWVNRSIVSSSHVNWCACNMCESSDDMLANLRRHHCVLDYCNTWLLFHNACIAHWDRRWAVTVHFAAKIWGIDWPHDVQSDCTSLQHYHSNSFGALWSNALHILVCSVRHFPNDYLLTPLKSPKDRECKLIDLFEYATHQELS